LVDLCLASIDGNLNDIKLEWKNRSAVCVVLASGGYPGDYKKGIEISGLEDAVWEADDTVVFHAGTKTDGRKFFTAGGRVLNVVSLGNDIKEAVDNTYKAVSKIKFEGMHYRKDIGRRALEKNEVKI